MGNGEKAATARHAESKKKIADNERERGQKIYENQITQI